MDKVFTQWAHLTEYTYQLKLLRMYHALRTSRLPHRAFMEAAAFVQALEGTVNEEDLTQILTEGLWVQAYESLVDQADDPKTRQYRARTLKAYQDWIHAMTHDTLEALPDVYGHHGIVLVPRYSVCYPPLLHQSPDHPPAFVFVSGSGYLAAITQPLSLAIVGSRKMTEYGKRFLETQLPLLLRHSIMIVSGMARGVDALAHRLTLAHKRPTLAVLGHGLDHCYPPEHQGLMDEIRANGAVLSEYPPHTPLVKQAFAARNRIIASLCAATFVVEADARSGALITANKATAAHRDVLALPGSVFAPMSRGCLDLINQGAIPIRNNGDILNALVGERQASQDGDTPAPINARLDPDQKALLTLLRSEPLTTDQAVERLERPLIAMMKLLTECELMGMIAQDQGRFFLTSYGYSCI